MRCLVKEAELDKGLDKGREALVAERAANDGASLRNLVLLLEDGRIAVGVRHERLVASRYIRSSNPVKGWRTLTKAGEMK